MSREEEERLIAEVWEHRGDDEYWDFDNPIRLRTGSEKGDAIPLTIDVSRAQIVALNEVADAKGVSVGAVVCEALDRLLAEAQVALASEAGAGTTHGAPAPDDIPRRR